MGVVRYGQVDRLDLKPLERNPASDAIVWGAARRWLLRVESPIDRWRLNVAMVAQQLAPLIAALAVGGLVGREAGRPWADPAFRLVAALVIAVAVFLLSAIALGLLGLAAGVWRPGDAR